MNVAFLILENYIISFVPFNPHTTKLNKLHKITAPTRTSRNINKPKEMILYNTWHNSRSAKPRQNGTPQRTKTRIVKKQVLRRLNATTTWNTTLSLRRNDATGYQIVFDKQPIPQKSPSKNSHLQRNLSVPNLIRSNNSIVHLLRVCLVREFWRGEEGSKFYCTAKIIRRLI